ncbi:uncharacterized protein LOC130139641 [Syzygium oleosum]|uniref:uncharacterized protein LOC130139641 n=1 Tax=Syzygium oleosum TaxID=219896 RepID=UPI0024BAF3AF|nr:uncharacterized protein LOC130139641 [Syzygium oleosum]
MKLLNVQVSKGGKMETEREGVTNRSHSPVVGLNHRRYCRKPVCQPSRIVPAISNQVRRMASPPTRFGNPVEKRAEVLTVIDARKGRAYRRITTYVMVDEGLTDLVPHLYVAWHGYTDGEWVGPLRGFNGPFGGVGRPAPGHATGGV